MKQAKKFLSWMIVVAMMFSLLPGNLAYAEGEDENGAEVYSVYLSPYVEVSSGPYSEEDFSISVPDNQDGVTMDEDYNWLVTGSFTFNVTIPELCDVDCLSVCNYGEELNDVEFVETATANTYEVTINPTESMSISVKDSTYYPILSSSIYVTSFNIEFKNANEENVDYVKNGGSYNISITGNGEATATIDNLEITVNGETITPESDSNGGWFYTVNNVTEAQTVKAYETGTKIPVSVNDVPDTGYWIFDASGENELNIAEAEFFPVDKGSDLTFRVKSTGTALDYAMCVDGVELQPTKIDDYTYSYTVSNVQDSVSVFFEKKYKVNMKTEGVLMIPCTDEGKEIEIYGTDGVSEYYARGNNSTYFKLAGSGKYSIIIENDEESQTLYPDDNGVYCVYIEEQDINLTAQRLYKVSIGETGNCGITVETDDISCHEEYDENTEQTYYYTSDKVIFTVSVWEDDYDVSTMEVKLKGADGNVTPLEVESEGPSEEEPSLHIYTFVSDTLTQDVEIQVTGVYSTEPNTLTLYYYTGDFSDGGSEGIGGINVKVVDEDGNALEFEEEYYRRVSCQIYEGKRYYLEMTGTDADLEAVRMKADGEKLTDLTGTIEDGILRAEVTGKSSIHITKGDMYFVSSQVEDDMWGAYPCVYNLEYKESLSGYYPKGEISFWLAEEDNTITTENAQVTSIKNSEGNEVTYTKEENVEVDDYGTKRTVYTLNLEDDIVIKYAGAEYRKYDVYLPLPGQNDEYTISNLYTISGVWDENDNYTEVPSDFTGTADLQNNCTKYSGIQTGTIVKFDITLDANKGKPYVLKSETNTGGVYSKEIYPESEEELGDGTVKYTYSFELQGVADIDISTNTITTNVELVGEGTYYKTFNENSGSWAIYDEDPEADDEVFPVFTISGLPKVINLEDTDKEYIVSCSIDSNEKMLDPACYDTFLTAKKQDGTEQYLTTSVDEENRDFLEYSMPVSDGYYTLVVDMNSFMQRNGFVKFESRRDNIMTPVICGIEGTDYRDMGNGEYLTLNQTLTFSVTAESKEDFEEEDFYLAMRDYDWDRTYKESNNGRTRTYTVTNVCWDGTICATYPAYIEFKESSNGYIYSNPMGDGGYWDEDGNIVYGIFSAGDSLGLDVAVNPGYDVESLYVVQEYTDEDGNKQMTKYNDFTDNAWQDDRQCSVILQPGMNTFYLTQPEKKTYTINLPNSAAYTLELVNGSKTSVEYLGSFSFKVKANAGYDLSSIIVSANGQKLTPDANGIYTIKNVREDIDIAISGFKTNQYIVTFKDYNGSVLKKQTVTSGKAATAPASPSRKGYRFVGWDKTFTFVKSDLVVTATYKPILVSKISIDGDITNLAVGKTVKLTTEVTPLDALNQGVVWSTSNKKYATVDANGKVKALAAGAGKTVTITAKAKDDSGVKATFKIKIYKNAITKIKLSAKSKSVKAGKKVTVKAKVSPSKGIYKTLKWSCSNTKYATVSSKGVVTAKKEGKGKTVTITAKAMDGSNKKATIKIKIKK